MKILAKKKTEKPNEELNEELNETVSENANENADTDNTEECVQDNSEKDVNDEEKTDVSESDEKYKALEDKYFRLAAEYKNFQTRSAREKDELYSKSVADTVEKLLPVLDSVERASKMIDEASSAKDVSEGIALISKMTKEVFEKIGVTEIEAVGKTFDANVHNAVMHIDDEAYGENEVAEEFMKGYKYKDKVIRYSMVKVAN